MWAGKAAPKSEERVAQSLAGIWLRSPPSCPKRTRTGSARPALALVIRRRGVTWGRGVTGTELRPKPSLLRPPPQTSAPLVLWPAANEISRELAPQTSPPCAISLRLPTPWHTEERATIPPPRRLGNGPPPGQATRAPAHGATRRSRTPCGPSECGGQRPEGTLMCDAPTPPPTALTCRNVRTAPAPGGDVPKHRVLAPDPQAEGHPQHANNHAGDQRRETGPRPNPHTTQEPLSSSVRCRAASL